MAFQKINMMTATEVVAEVFPDVNFDEALITRYIFAAQVRYIKPVLGGDLYEEIVSEINTASLSADNQELLDNWIKPTLGYFTAYLALPQIRNEVTEAGVVNNLTETSVVAEVADYANIRHSFLDMGQMWVNNITSFITEAQKDDSSKYPLYNDCSGDKDFSSTNIVFY